MFERNKFRPGSRVARRLLQWESSLFQNSDVVIADTDAHAEFFRNTHKLDSSQLAVIPVSAEEELFVQQPTRSISQPIHVMFYGSFIGLQEPQFIVEAARIVPNVQWTFIGSGPLLSKCKEIADGRSHINFIPRIPYDTLPDWIGQADILLGVFGTSGKAGRIIPNKVYQSLACGRPVVTQQSNSYPVAVRKQSAAQSGIFWVSAGRSDQVADTVRKLVAAPNEILVQSNAARRTFDKWFNNQIVQDSLLCALKRVNIDNDSITRFIAKRH